MRSEAISANSCPARSHTCEQGTATQDPSCCNAVCCSGGDAMLHSACCQCQPLPSLTCCSTSKARVSLRPPCRLGRKSGELLLQETQIRKRRFTTRSRSQRHVVTSAYADLQTTFQPLVTRNLTATVLAVVGAYVWVRLFDWLANKGVLKQVGRLCMQTHNLWCSYGCSRLSMSAAVQTLSRKLVHITSGPLFVLTWPLFR